MAFEEELEVAIDLARKAGEEILDHYSRDIIAEEKLGVDKHYEPVTAAERKPASAAKLSPELMSARDALAKLAAEGARRVTFEEAPDDIRQNMLGLGWDIAGWEREDNSTKTGENVFKCYQCQKCTAGCPVAIVPT